MRVRVKTLFSFASLKKKTKANSQSQKKKLLDKSFLWYKLLKKATFHAQPLTLVRQMKAQGNDGASKTSELEYTEPDHPEFTDLRPAALDPDRNADGTFVKGHSGCWKPGESGNPNGRPPNGSKPPKPPALKTISSLMKHMLDKTCTVKGYRNLTWKEALAKRILKFTIEEGKPQLVREVLDRTEGTVKQLHEVEATSKTIIEFVVAKPPPGFGKNRMNGQLNGLSGKGMSN